MTSPRSTPPPAALDATTEVLYGRTIRDPYRWLEQASPESTQWLQAQARHARKTLDGLPDRAELLARVHQLDDGAGSIIDVKRRAGVLFYLGRLPGQELYRLCRRSDKETVLIDPARFATKGVRYSIDYYEPSPDGRLVAFGISANNSEDAVLHVVDVATGELLSDEIDRARWSFPTWQPDGRSFFYKRERKRTDAAEPLGRARVYFHVVGAATDEDALVFGAQVPGGPPISEQAGVSIRCPPDGRYLFGMVADGAAAGLAVYMAPRPLATNGRPWQRIIAPDDEIDEFEIHGDDLYLKSYRGAPAGRILRTRLSHPDLAHATTVLAASSAAVVRMVAAADALYVQLLDEGIGRIVRIPFATGVAVPVALPMQGAIRPWTLVASGAQPGALLQLESWTAAPALLAIDAAAHVIDLAPMAPAAPAVIDLSDIRATAVEVVSDDGTKVPLTIVHRHELRSDGANPALLEAYGAYGTVMAPRFDPMLLAWLERGGLYAVCHARGGGERGEGWHTAGMLATKNNTVVDYVACARYLVDRKYSAPARLAGLGFSAGGIPVANALVRHPELFGAVVLRSAMVNALRFEQLPIGPANRSEFGTVDTQAGFEGLLAIDAYQQVEAGRVYPAVLLTTGASDSRVSPWQSAKLAARLQAASTNGKPILLRIDDGAGHGAGAGKSQAEAERADIYAFLWAQLGGQR